MTRRLYLLGRAGAVTPQGCRPLQVTTGTVTWWSCTCRPHLRVTDPARVLHGADRPDDTAGTIPTPRRSK